MRVFIKNKSAKSFTSICLSQDALSGPMWLWTIVCTHALSMVYTKKEAIKFFVILFCNNQGRSQEFVTGGEQRVSGGRKSPSGVQGQSPGGGLGRWRSPQKP